MKNTPKILAIGIATWTCLTVWGQYAGRGIASYYSDKLHGRYMSNGERYHMDSMTCAHMKYPLGTMLKVRNPLNGKEVIVKVTDRGPHTKKFIIDLSKAAAKKIGVYHAGWTTVEITPYRAGQSPYKLEDTVEVIPELDLNYQPVATYPDPGWKKEPGKSKTVHTNTTPVANIRQKIREEVDTDTIIPPIKPIKKEQVVKTTTNSRKNKANSSSVKTSTSNNSKTQTQNKKKRN